MTEMTGEREMDEVDALVAASDQAIHDMVDRSMMPLRKFVMSQLVKVMTENGRTLEEFLQQDRSTHGSCAYNRISRNVPRVPVEEANPETAEISEAAVEKAMISTAPNGEDADILSPVKKKRKSSDEEPRHGLSKDELARIDALKKIPLQKECDRMEVEWNKSWTKALLRDALLEAYADKRTGFSTQASLESDVIAQSSTSVVEASFSTKNAQLTSNSKTSTQVATKIASAVSSTMGRVKLAIAASESKVSQNTSVAKKASNTAKHIVPSSKTLPPQQQVIQSEKCSANPPKSDKKLVPESDRLAIKEPPKNSDISDPDVGNIEKPYLETQTLSENLPSVLPKKFPQAFSTIPDSARKVEVTQPQRENMPDTPPKKIPQAFASIPGSTSKDEVPLGITASAKKAYERSLQKSWHSSAKMPRSPKHTPVALSFQKPPTVVEDLPEVSHGTVVDTTASEYIDTTTVSGNNANSIPAINQSANNVLHKLSKQKSHRKLLAEKKARAEKIRNVAKNKHLDIQTGGKISKLGTSYKVQPIPSQSLSASERSKQDLQSKMRLKALGKNKVVTAQSSGKSFSKHLCQSADAAQLGAPFSSTEKSQSLSKAQKKSPFLVKRASTKKERIPENNYEMTDIEDSDYDTDDSRPRPVKRLPLWANRENIFNALDTQYAMDYRVDPDELFGEVETCDLDSIFGRNKDRSYRYRNSSGNWDYDGVTHKEKLQYKRSELEGKRKHAYNTKH